jgi:hypothetical protein
VTQPRISILTRAQWKAAPPNPAHLSTRRDTLLGVTFHHTTGANLGDVDTAQWARNIQRFCMVTRGYGDLEYNAMIRAYVDPHDGQPRGVFVEGRDVKYVGAHAASTGNVANRTTTGVALMGDADEVLSHPELVPTVHALVNLCWYFQQLYSHAHKVAHTARYGHREWMPKGGTATVCPESLLTIVHGLK